MCINITIGATTKSTRNDNNRGRMHIQLVVFSNGNGYLWVFWSRHNTHLYSKYPRRVFKIVNSENDSNTQKNNMQLYVRSYSTKVRKIALFSINQPKTLPLSGDFMHYYYIWYIDHTY